MCSIIALVCTLVYVKVLVSTDFIVSYFQNNKTTATNVQERFHWLELNELIRQLWSVFIFSMFLSKNKKNRYTPAYPSFTLQKWGSRGYTLHGHVFLM